ncbi:protein PDF-like [Haematobia irritans]|uniref:protein PDF-like n=1 Tax=Haematobia irritans TaxID=7368 RepID=UPI003F502CB1
MANITQITVVLVVVSLCVWNTAIASPSAEDNSYFDRQMNRDMLTKWISSVRNGQVVTNPCRYYTESSWPLPSMPKRNSELINSLLSLPKSMNDAGK